MSTRESRGKVWIGGVRVLKANSDPWKPGWISGKSCSGLMGSTT